MVEETATPPLHGLLRLTYRSTPAPTLGEAELSEIIAQAVPANSALGLNSCIYTSDAHFLQVLEAPKEIVDVVFRKLHLDRRHSDLQTLGYCQIKRRLFPTCSMLRLHEAEDPELDELIRQCSQFPVQPVEADESPWLQAVLDKLRNLVKIKPPG